MAFTTFVSGTAADADEVMANFYHIAQGDRLPRGGTSLDPTNSVYNIGATATTWAGLHCVNFDCTNIEITGSITSDSVKHVLISSTVTNTSSIEITGLQGDSEKEYFVELDFTFVNTLITVTMNLIFNQDSSASYGFNGPSISSTDASSIYFFDHFSTSFPPFHCTFDIMAKSGYPRMMLIHSSRSPATTFMGRYTGVWNNTSDELTSIKFIASSTLASIKISIWQS